MNASILQLFGLSPHLAPSFVNGTFEVTLGAKAAATEASDAGLPLVDRVAAAAFILSWAGLSVHAQVAGLMSRTAWRYLPFAQARLIHGFMATALVYLIWPLFRTDEAAVAPALAWANWAPWPLKGPSAIRAYIPTATWIPLMFLIVLTVIVTAGTMAIGIGNFKRRKEV